MTSTLTLSAGTDRRLIPDATSATRIIEWVIKAADVARRDSRPPFNLALVLDRSGSMMGHKLQFVKAATKHVLDLLSDQDRVALVVYDDEISVLAASQPVTAARRDELKLQVDRVQSGGATDLGGGWLCGCQEVADNQRATAVNRALLLTDGLANRGMVDGEELAVHARELRRRGVSTSTFGVGVGFNEQLLEALAEQGGGHFFYIDQPSSIPDVFRGELGELATTVAREAVLTIPIPPGVGVEVLGALPHEQDGTRVRIFLGDLSANEERRCYVRILTPREPQGSRLTVMATLSYADLHGRAETEHSDLAWTYARESEVQAVASDAALLGRQAEVEAAVATKHALEFERLGQRGAAKAVLQQMQAANAPHMTEAGREEIVRLGSHIDQGLSEAERKERHFNSYKKRSSRN